MSVCPSPEEKPAPTRDALEEIRRLQGASKTSKENYEAILVRIKQLEKYLKEYGEKPQGGAEKG